MPVSQSSEITAEELKIILKVIEKDEEVLNQEDKYINSLKEKLTLIRDFSLTPTEEAKNIDTCVRCKATLSWARRIFNPLLTCSFCNRRICYNCNTAAKSQSPLCIYCSVLRQIEAATGAWFFKGKGATEIETLNGTYVLKNKLLHSPKQKDIRKQKYDINTPVCIETKITSILEEYKPDNLSPNILNKSVKDEKKSSIEQLKMPTTNPVSEIRSSVSIISEKLPEKLLNKSPNKSPKKLPDKSPEKLPEKLPDKSPKKSPDKSPERLPDKSPEKLPELKALKEIKTASLQRVSSIKSIGHSPPPSNKPPSVSLDAIRIDAPKNDKLSPIDMKKDMPLASPTYKIIPSVIKEAINKSIPENNVTLLEKACSEDAVKNSNFKKEILPTSVNEPMLSDSGTPVGKSTFSSIKRMTSLSLNNGMLCGAIKYEKSGKDTLKLKIKISEAMGLKPLSNEISVNCYVIVRITQNGVQLFKEKTSLVKDCSAPIWNEIFDISLVSPSWDNLVIYLLILRPTKKSIMKILTKQPKDLDNNYYGSVRLGLANYISNEEQNVFKKLKSNVENNINDWFDFKIELNRVETRLSLTDDTIFPEENLASPMNNISSPMNNISSPVNNLSSTISASADFLKADDVSSFQSVSSQFYGCDPINGKIYVGLKYSDNVFSVDIVKAEGLVTVGKSLASKVFAKCKMLSNIEQPSKKTTIAKKTLNPIWNSSFIFNLDTSNMCSNSLSITVYNSEPFKKKTFIGEVLIPIGSLIASNNSEINVGYSEWFDLSPKIPHGLVGFKGVLMVSLRFDPISYDGLFGNLEVRVPNANNIHLNPNKSEPIDTYVRSMLLPNTDKKECRKSQIIYKSNNPEYKFSFSFYNISRDELRNIRCLEISIWTKSSKFIGGVRLCSRIQNTFLESWQDSSEVEYNLWRGMMAKHKEWISASIPLRFTFISQNIYPSLINNVNKIWNDYMRQNGTLRFRARFDSDKTDLIIEIKELLGLILENFSLICYIKLRSRGQGLKREFHFLEQSCPNQWNKSVVFSAISNTDLTTIEIRLLAQKLQSSKKYNFKSDIKSHSTVIGRILLSKGLTKEPWDTPTADEIKFYDLIINTPNVWHSNDMQINSFTQTTKKVQFRVKSDKSNLRKSKSITRINDLYPSSSNKKDNIVNIDTEENTEDSQVQAPKILSRFNSINRKSMINIFKKPDLVSKGNDNNLPKSSLTFNTLPSSMPKASVNSAVVEKAQPSTSPDKSDICKDIKISNQYTSKEIFIDPIQPISDGSPAKISKQDQTDLVKITKDATVPVPSNGQQIAASNKLQFANSQTNVLTPLINQSISQEIPFKGIASDNFLHPSPICINLCQSIPKQASLPLKNSVKTPLFADNFTTINLPRESLFSSLSGNSLSVASTKKSLHLANKPRAKSFSKFSIYAIKNRPIGYSLSLYNLPKEGKAMLSIRDIKNTLTKKALTLENVSKEFGTSKSIDHTNDKIFTITRYILESIPRNCDRVDFSHNTITPQTPSISLTDFPIHQKFSQITSVANKSNAIINNLTIINLPKTESNNHLEYQVVDTPSIKKDIPSQISDQQQNIPKKEIPVPSVANTSKTTVSSNSASMLSKDQSYDSSHSNLPSISETPISSTQDVSVSVPHASNSEKTSSEASDLPSIDRKESDGAFSSTAQSQASDSKRSVQSSSKLNVSRASVIPKDSKKDHISLKRLSTISFGSKKKLDKDDLMSDSVSIYGDTKISGDILIGFKYLNVRNQLTVTIKKASNLSAGDQTKKIDPYVKLQMLPEKNKSDKLKTKAIKNTLNPSWDENFTFTYNTTDLKLRKLAISIWHHQIGRKLFLGEAIIPIGETVQDVIKRGYTESWYTLCEKSKSAVAINEELPIGQLEIGLCIEKNAIPTPSPAKKSSKKSTLDSILKLKIIEARNIATFEPVNFAICKIYLQPDKAHKTKKKTAHTENKAGRYVWNADIEYEVDSEKIQDNGLEIKIIDSKKKKHKLGCIHLNNGAKTASWQDATAEEADIWRIFSSNMGIYQNFIVQIRPDKKSSK